MADARPRVQLQKTPVAHDRVVLRENSVVALIPADLPRFCEVSLEPACAFTST